MSLKNTCQVRTSCICKVIRRDNKVGVLGWDHPFSWSLKSCPCKRKEKKNWQEHRRKPCEAGGPVWRHATRNGHSQAFSLTTIQGLQLCQHLDFKLLVSRIMREWISVVSSHWVSVSLLWRDWGINPRGSNRFPTGLCVDVRRKFFLLATHKHMINSLGYSGWASNWNFLASLSFYIYIQFYFL